MAAREPEACQSVPHSLLTLHEKTHGTSLDGEGIQAWLEWEMEAMRWDVPVEIFRADFEALVNRRQRTYSKAPKTTSKGEESA